MLTILNSKQYTVEGDAVLCESDFKDALSKWDWSFFFHSVHCLGGEFNEASWRMMKGNVVCEALEMCSDNQAKYVDEVGFDLLVGDTKVEVKTEVGIIHKNMARTKKIQLKNIRGTAGLVPVLKRTFDYLLIINTGLPFASAFATWETVERNHYLTPDQIQCQLSSQDLVFISRGTVRISDQISSPFSMKKKMIEEIHEWLGGVKNQVDKLPEDSRITDY